jgi:hypothetical protein
MVHWKWYSIFNVREKNCKIILKILGTTVQNLFALKGCVHLLCWVISKYCEGLIWQHFRRPCHLHLEAHGQVPILVVPTQKVHAYPIIKLVDMWPRVKRSELDHFQNKFPQFCPVSWHFNHYWFLTMNYTWQCICHIRSNVKLKLTHFLQWVTVFLR